MRAQIVSFHCVLRSQVGNQVLSSTFNHDVITQVEGAEDRDVMLKGLAKGLKNLKKGERRQIMLTAKEAYGFYDPSLLRESPRSEISNGTRLALGNQVQMMTEDGRTRNFRVVAADSRTVTLDGNHPLAGMDLVFDIEATAARYATAMEIAESRAEEVAPARLLH